ncbi:MAG TPA: metallophosphoesterase [Candidatus Thermoplasmatota archaeon]|nr:metallophosphoesterase [Candidatus Thermoplasmatota archaeon]
MRLPTSTGLALLLAACLAAGCLGRPVAPEPVPPDAEPAAVRFVVVGDTGTGDWNEYAVARAIGTACADRGCDLVVHTGDILYDDGAFSVDDPQFEDKFEIPYGSLGLPVYLVLGNHDVGNDPHAPEDLGRWQAVGDVAVAYSNRTGRTTDAWHMPGRWYAFTQGPVAFVAFDSSAFVYAPLESDTKGPLHEAVNAQAAFAMAQWGKVANATWRFAVAHHPYVSNGGHGDAEDLDDDGLHGKVLDWFYETHVCHKADVLLTGHDHDLQWLAPVEPCGPTRFLVSGAGARPRPLQDPLRNAAIFQAGDLLGFWWLEAKGPRLRLAAFDVDGRVLYESEVAKETAASTSAGTAA